MPKIVYQLLLIPFFMILSACHAQTSATSVPSTSKKPTNMKYLRLSDLSDEQQTKISDLKTKLFQGLRPLLATENQQKASLEEVMKSANASDAELKRLFAILQETRKQASDLRFQHLLAVRNLLTPEQRVRASNQMVIRFATPPHHQRQGGMLEIDSQ